LQATKAYGVLYGSTTCVASTPGCASQKIEAPGLEGRISKRSFFFVDKEGIVRGKWIGVDSAAFSSEVLLKAAQEIAGKPAEGAGEKKASGM